MKMNLSIKNLWKVWRYGDLNMVLAALAAQSINISVGVCQGYSAVLLPQLASDRPEFSAEQASWIASLGVISNPIGALLGGALVDYVGRKSTLQSIAIPGLMGWLTIALSSSYAGLCIGRFVTGFTIGMSTATYIYVAEVSTPSARGVLAAVGPALVSLGIFLVYVLGSFYHWKTVASACAGISIITPLLMQWVPESPLWLASKGRVKDAYQSMYWLRQNNNLAQQELDEFSKGNTELKDNLKDKMKSLARWSVLRPFLILLTFFLFQELSGIYIILYYAVDFFKGVGTSMNEFTASMVVGGLRVIMGVVGACLISQIRRRVLAATSGIMLGVAMLAAAICDSLGGDPTIKLVCVLAHVCASMIGFLQLPWIMSGELYPQRIRGIMSGVTSCCAYILIFLNIKTYPDLVNIVTNNGTLYMFGACAILGALYCLLFLPETKGKSLAEITQCFEDEGKMCKDTESGMKKGPQASLKIVGRKSSAPTVYIINNNEPVQYGDKPERKLSV